MTEKPAEGITGFFLYNPFTKRHFFRVYDPEDKRIFTDYKVCAEDVEVTILAGGVALYEDGEGNNRLDWSSEALGKDLVPGPVLAVPCKTEGCGQEMKIPTYNKPLTISVRCKNDHRHHYESKPLRPDEAVQGPDSGTNP